MVQNPIIAANKKKNDSLVSIRLGKIIEFQTCFDFKFIDDKKRFGNKRFKSKRY